MKKTWLYLAQRWFSPIFDPVAVGHSPRILCSGYFADWAQLTEFLEAYSASRLRERCPVLLQGHHMGTNHYLARVKSAARSLGHVNIRID